MSADNFIAVFSEKDSLGRDIRWYAAHGMMPSIESPEYENEWKKNKIQNSDGYATREAALVAAHDRVKQGEIVEYGVIEL